jgi:hypothetical protein
MLMICTPLVPDRKIIEVFGELFRENHITEEWVLEFGEKHLAEKLATLVSRGCSTGATPQD